MEIKVVRDRNFNVFQDIFLKHILRLGRIFSSAASRTLSGSPSSSVSTVRAILTLTLRYVIILIITDNQFHTLLKKCLVKSIRNAYNLIKIQIINLEAFQRKNIKNYRKHSKQRSNTVTSSAAVFEMCLKWRSQDFSK